MRLIAKLLVAFVGWYIFTSMGILPAELRNPIYPYIARLDNFDVQTVSEDCYSKYVNPGRNANLSVCATSGMSGVAAGYTAYTGEEKTYFTMDSRLYECTGDDLDFYEIYGKLQPNSTAVSVLGKDHIVVLGQEGRSELVQVQEGKKMHTAFSRWNAYARGGGLYERGPFVEVRGVFPSQDFLHISRNLYDYLEEQRQGRVTVDKLCALLYYQSVGLIVDYYQRPDGTYRAVFADPWRTERRVYTADGNGVQLLTELPQTGGYFCREGEFYYSVDEQVFRLDLDSGESTPYYSAPDRIRYLNYFVAPVTETDRKSAAYTGQEQVLVLALVTESKVIYYSPLGTVTGGHDYDDEDFENVVKGYYVSSYPYHTLLMALDGPEEDPVRIHKYRAREEEF